jgi:hypothetical protein
MRPLSSVERFFERLFERPTARIFRPRLHPVQILRRVERAMERGRRVEAGRTTAPDRFTVRLHPADLARLEPDADLAVELATGALAFARRQGFSLLGRPRVAVIGDATGHPGEVEVEGRFSSGSPGSGQAEPGSAIHGTRVFEVPVARAARATLVLREPHLPPRSIPVEGGTLTIGRGASNGLALDDGRVSRRHARLVARDGLLILTDLGSTNGTRVNGQAIRELTIGAGDEIRIGDSVIDVAAVDDTMDDGPDTASVGPGTGR